MPFFLLPSFQVLNYDPLEPEIPILLHTFDQGFKIYNLAVWA